MVRQTAKDKSTGPTLLVGVDVLQTPGEWQAHRRVYLRGGVLARRARAGNLFLPMPHR